MPICTDQPTFPSIHKTDGLAIGIAPEDLAQPQTAFDEKNSIRESPHPRVDDAAVVRQLRSNQ